LAGALEEAASEFGKSGEVARRFDEFKYRILEGWSREQRVIGKAEYMAQGANH